MTIFKLGWSGTQGLHRGEHAGIVWQKGRKPGQKNVFKLAGLAAAGGVIGLDGTCLATEKGGAGYRCRPSRKEFLEKGTGAIRLDPDQVYMNIGTTGSSL